MAPHRTDTLERPQWQPLASLMEKTALVDFRLSLLAAGAKPPQSPLN